MDKDGRSKVVCDVYEDLNATSFIEDSDGYLRGRAVVTTIGVFPYLMNDGSVFNELRLPEEVFDRESLESLKMKPITNDHPSVAVSPSNVKDLQVGTTGEDVSWFDIQYDGSYGYKTDGSTLSIPLVITDKEAVEAVKQGKRALSCGYSRDLELISGKWCGIPYDGIQRNIRYNHVAIVDRGRAGDAAVIRMDGAFVPTSYRKDCTDQKGKTMKNIIIDEKAYEVDDAVKIRMDSLQESERARMKDIERLKGDNAGLEGTVAAQKVRIDELEANMAKMINADQIPALVKERQEVKDTADKFGVKLDNDMSVLDMKREVIKVAAPSMADSIDEKTDTFVNGAFDVCKSFEGRKAVDNNDTFQQSSGDASDDQSGHKDDNADEFNYDALNARLTSIWKK